MAPKRRSAGARHASASQQATLSFHGKHSKITKPTSAHHSKDVQKDPALADKIVHTSVQPEVEVKVEEPTTAEKAIQQQAHQEVAPDPLETSVEQITATDVLGGRAQPSDTGAVGGRGDGWVGNEEQQARKTTDAQIKKYWRRKEEERLAPRVHQQDLTTYEKVLREWDMSGQYGVSALTFNPELEMPRTDNMTAVHRHCKIEAMETCKFARFATANRSAGCPA
nr:hypothetical protein CFP56_12097 [Quercus suber]